jgi:hypothetical protein
LSNSIQLPPSDEHDEDGSDEGDEGDEEIEVGIIGKLPVGQGTLCSCKRNKTKRVYHVRHNNGKLEYLCKAMVQQLKCYKKWKKDGWFVLSVMDEKPLDVAKKEDPCTCGQEDCSKYCIYEVQGWYQDELENEWTPESHLTENEPGKAALRKWKQEAARNGAKHFFRR